MRRFLTVSTVLIAAFVGTVALAQNMDLPQRQGARPETTNGVPHTQIGVTANPALSQELLRRVETLQGVALGQTRVSLPGAVGFQLARDMFLAHPEVIVGGREFAHIHPDGSLHASLSPDTAKAAVAAGWAIAHPWAQERDGWEGLVMLYTPRTEAELEVIYALVEASYSFVTGNPVP